jgi:hypothetical protein
VAGVMANCWTRIVNRGVGGPKAFQWVGSVVVREAGRSITLGMLVMFRVCPFNAYASDYHHAFPQGQRRISPSRGLSSAR